MVFVLTTEHYETLYADFMLDWVVLDLAAVAALGGQFGVEFRCSQKAAGSNQKRYGVGQSDRRGGFC